MLNGQIVIQAAIGDGDPQPAILDIGLPRCILTQDAASKLFLPTETAIDMPTFYGPAHVPTVKAQNVRIGALVLNNVAFAVCDLWKQLSSNPPPDAPSLWIGTSALTAQCVTIDPSAGTITFGGARSPMPRDAKVVSFDTSDGRVWVEARAEGSRKYPRARHDRRDSDAPARVGDACA